MKKNILKSSKFDFLCLVKWISFPLIFLGLFLLASTHAHSAVLYVSPDGDNTTGASWENAFQTIQAAIDAASTDDEIWVKQGTYSLTTEINVNKAVAIYGGFYGTETARGQRDWQTYETIVDGQNSVRCLYISAVATNKPIVRIDYDIEAVSQPSIESMLDEFIEKFVKK